MDKKINLRNCVVILVFFLVITCKAAPGAVIYVDASVGVSGDGSSWGTAFKYLQDALAIAQDGTDILVSAGTYTPDRNSSEPNGSGDIDATFQLITGVGIYGGFPPGGGNWEDRNWQVHETILSGDLDGNDIAVSDAEDLYWPSPILYGRADNCRHVVTGSGTYPTAVLDGFVISGGEALYHGHVEGGAMWNDGGSPTIINCTFTQNAAGLGGGMANYYGSNPAVINCMFSINLACCVGGGMRNYDNSSPTIINCIFYRNQGDYGAGMQNEDNSSPILTNSVFIGNGAPGEFWGFWGGGMHNYQSAPTLINCSFSGNRADWGAGMYNKNSSPTLINSTFSGNSADAYDGGGIFDFNSTSTLNNCILWGNSADANGSQIALDQSSIMEINYCNIYGGGNEIYIGTDSGYTWGLGNIGADPTHNPLFVDPQGPDLIVGTFDDNLHLSGGSPCIDAGDNDAVPPDTLDLDGDGNMTEPIPLDLDGDARFFDDVSTMDTGNGTPPVVDMGAYELGCGDPPYPYPIGDLNRDCRVNFYDIAIVSAHWLECTIPECD